MRLINIKKIIKYSFKLLGLSISKSHSTKPIAPNVLKIEYVIDVGANEGQFAQDLRKSSYNGLIYSFEPLFDAHKKLVLNSLSDPKWFIHKPIACGSQQGKLSINIAGNSASSSIKKMLASHLNAAPYSKTVGFQDIDVVTLDSELDRWLEVKAPIFLKIDTQGYEEEVLAGAEKTLKVVEAVQIELSILELYQGQKSYDYFFEFFADRDFLLFDILPGFTNYETGQLLQFDAIFVRKSYLNKYRAFA
jgi:FkbM family methyltransferase